MIFLAASILASSLIFVVFRTLSTRQISIFPTLVINYWVAAGVGLILFPNWLNNITAPLLLFSVFLGSMFIGIFYSMAQTTAVFGIGIASVITKMSLIIPVLIGFLIFNEQLSWLSWAGIFIGLLSIFFNTYAGNSNATSSVSKAKWLFPILCFFGSGIIDSAIQIGEKQLLSQANMPTFIMLTFFVAAVIGSIVLLASKRLQLKKNNLSYGIGLGIINYFSIYFLIEALRTDTLISAAVFPINNIGIVALSVFFSVFFFREKLNGYRQLGLVLSLIAIYLLSS